MPTCTPLRSMVHTKVSIYLRINSQVCYYNQVYSHTDRQHRGPPATAAFLLTRAPPHSCDPSHADSNDRKTSVLACFGKSQLHHRNPRNLHMRSGIRCRQTHSTRAAAHFTLHPAHYTQHTLLRSTPLRSTSDTAVVRRRTGEPET